MRYRLAAPSWPIREASAPAVGAGQAAAQSLRIEVARAAGPSNMARRDGR